jgi:hypothetical protein
MNAMTAKTIYQALLWVQGLYTLLTALWGLFHIKSFMQVTGPKTDVWLVKTVSVLLLPMVVLFFGALFLEVPPLPVILVGSTTAAGLAAIDFYYTANRTIKWVYAADGILEVIFFVAWMYLAVARAQLQG